MDVYIIIVTCIKVKLAISIVLTVSDMDVYFVIVTCIKMELKLN